MSKSATSPPGSSPPRSWQHFETELEDLGLHGPFFNKNGEGVDYPNYIFNIDVTLLMSSERGVISITPETKMRSYMKTIARTCGDDFPKFATFANPSVRDMELRNAKKFRETTITIDKQKVRRSTLIDTGSALDILYKQLEKENHPAWQFMEQLKPALSEGLSLDLFNEIRENIANVSAWPRLKEIYQLQINNHKLAPRFQTLLGLIMPKYGV